MGPADIRPHIPFRPSRIGDGPEWLGLCVEEFSPQPPCEMLTPPEDHFQINLGLSPETSSRAWAGLSEHRYFPPAVIAIVPPGEAVRWAWPKGSAHCIHVHYPRKMLLRAAEANALDPDKALAMKGSTGHRDDALAALLKLFHRELVTPRIGTERFLEGLVVQLGIELLRQKFATPSPLVLEAIALVDARPERTIDVAGLAARLDVSVFQLTRAFRLATGEPPARHLTRRKLDAAADDLAASARPIAQIAADLGFADQSHLTRLFRQRYGATPREFRREAQGRSNPPRQRRKDVL